MGSVHTLKYRRPSPGDQTHPRPATHRTANPALNRPPGVHRPRTGTGQGSGRAVDGTRFLVPVPSVHARPNRSTSGTEAPRPSARWAPASRRRR
ncbi:hypothetical protein [Streptomyces sp. NPDC091212]|uniref:hypothetical protein n=1 Tax=Streptomyces sp. NPDC091212 TaxID=3155191 RepID=UPI003417F2F3